MPLQELENNKKPEIIEELPVTTEEPKKRKPEEIENSSLWQRIKNKVLRPIRNVVFAIYNRIVLGKNYSDTVAKDYDRAREDGLINGMFEDGEYTPEDLTPEELAQEKEVLEGYEMEDLGDMFDAPLVEQKVAQKNMTTILKEKINEFSEKENIDKVKLISRSNILNNEISLEKDNFNNILISFKGKNMHKDFTLSPPYEEQDINKLTQEYQNFFSELKKQREVELEVIKMFEDPEQAKEDVAEIPDFSDSKEDVQINEAVAEIPDLNTLNDTSLESDSSSQVVEQELDEKDKFKNFDIERRDGKLRLTKYRGRDKDLIIPEGITSIGYRAVECESLRTANIPKSVELIESAAFANSKYLNSITFEGNPKLGENVFCYCNLKEMIVRNEEMKQYLIDSGEVPYGCEVKVVNEIITNLDSTRAPDSDKEEKSPATYIALSKGAFDKLREQAQDGDKILAQTKTKDKTIADVLYEKINGEEQITIDDVAQSPKKTENAINNIVDKNKQKEFKTAVITTVETINTYNEKGDYVVMSDTLTAKLSVKEEELTISVETLSGEVKEATIAYPPEKSEVTQTITDLLSQPEQNRTADQPLVVAVAEAIIKDEPSITQVEIGDTKTAQEAYEASFAEMLEKDIDGFEPDENGEMREKDQGDDFNL